MRRVPPPTFYEKGLINTNECVSEVTTHACRQDISHIGEELVSHKSWSTANP